MIAVHLIVEHAARAADWYASVFGAKEQHRITLPDGRLIDVELSFGGSMVVLADEFPEHGARSPKATGCSSAVFYLQTDDAEALWARALAHGAEVLRPLTDWFTGERDGQLSDPFGHRWGISQHIRDVPPDEIARSAAQVFGGTAEAADIAATER
jgi:PhnB protein